MVDRSPTIDRDELVMLGFGQHLVSKLPDIRCTWMTSGASNSAPDLRRCWSGAGGKGGRIRSHRRGRQFDPATAHHEAPGQTSWLPHTLKQGASQAAKRPRPLLPGQRQGIWRGMPARGIYLRNGRDSRRCSYRLRTARSISSDSSARPGGCSQLRSSKGSINPPG
jgi:hypothetical protein